MIGEWNVRHLPRCSHHVFLSHCAEDRQRLVHPLYRALEEKNILPWLDTHHYPMGQGAFEALREGIIRCRHVVYLVTASFLSQGRGWNSVENAYANLLQENLRVASLELCHVQLPLFFVPRTHSILLRSAWSPQIQRGRFYSSGRVDGKAAQWAATQITHFVKQNEIRGMSLAVQICNDPTFQTRLSAEPNLLQRIMCADPVSIA